MKNYDFQILSPFEFELLSRDLLQKHFGVHLESFGEGGDLGIDLRYCEGSNMIVQCKRYKSFSSLFSKLKIEVQKVEKLNPGRYLLTTSVDLNPMQKEKIHKLFSPYIKNFSDIMGKVDLNNLLNKFPEVESDYYKLWLASIPILQRIVNSQVVNQSKFILDEIQSKISMYVQNESFQLATSILKRDKYLIISGTPGIGKTTLAEMLVFKLLGSEMDEFIYLSESIKDGFKFYNEDKKQVFLFDDFLGRNFLIHSLRTNEDKSIMQFIQRIQRSRNKVLIFTTREYILNQAKQRFDLFENANFSKCIIDLTNYTKRVKSEILYNHFYANEIPFEYVKEIFHQKKLISIINHRNYNPRIIESFQNQKFGRKLLCRNFRTKY